MKTVITILAAAAILAPAAAGAQTDDQAIRVRPAVRVEQTRAQQARVRARQDRARQQQVRVQQQARSRATRDAQDRRRSSEEQTEKTSRTFTLGSNGELELSNLSGDIIITRGSGGSVQVEALKIARGRTVQEAREALGLVTVHFTERGSRAEVRTQYPQRRQRGTQSINVSVRYTVTAPENTRISASSVSGSVTVSDIRGDLNLVSISGQIAIQNGARVLGAKSTSGNVEITNLRSDIGLEANSISGNVRVRQSAAPRMELGSVSGNVAVVDVRCERLEAETISGNIDMTTPLEKGGRYELSSHTGVIRVVPTGNTGFELEADSFSGNIQSELTLDNVRQGTADYGRRTPRGRTRSLEGTYGDGGATLEITTFSGTVVIGKR